MAAAPAVAHPCCHRTDRRPADRTTRRRPVMPVSVTMSDSQQVLLTAAVTDAKGDAVTDTLSWAGDDGGAVVTLNVAGDTLSCEAVAVAEGVSNITVSD